MSFFQRTKLDNAAGTTINPATSDLQTSGAAKTQIVDGSGNVISSLANHLSVASKLIDEAGAAYGVKHILNKPRVSAMPYLYDIAEGNIPDHTAWTKIGFTPTMTTAQSDLWSLAGTMNWPAAGGIQMEVVSSNAADDTGGTGALTVRIYYLDAAWAEKTEDVTMDGTNPVDTVATNILRVNGFRVITTGTALAAVGNISLRNTAGAITYSYITAGYTRARNSAYTVPAGKTLYVSSFTVSYGYATNQTHYCRLYTRATQNEGAYVPGIFYPFTEVICANTSQHVPLEIPTKLVAKVDLKVSGIATFSGIASVALRGWLENA
jgi:hypothetical protein